MMNLNTPTNLNSSGSNKTTNYFNNYFMPDVAVTQNINDAILSYFEQQTSNIESAKLLVQAIIETAKVQRQTPMTVLTEFQNLPTDELNSILTLYLNTSRVPTSYLGVKIQPKTSPLVTRTIIA